MAKERKFFEVFPTYKTEDNEIQEMLASARVDGIKCSEERDRIDVSFISDHLIHKKIILKTERELQKTLFPTKKGKVTLEERFMLSDKYDLSNLLREYGNSILYELKVISPIMYQLYKEADRKLEDGNKLKLILPDTFIAHEQEDKIN